MGGADTTQNTQSQSVQQLPPWINQAAQQNYGFAQKTSPSSPCSNTRGEMVADVSPQMQQSWNTAATGGNAGAGPVQRRPGRLARRDGPAAAAGHGGATEQHQPAAVYEPVHAVGDQLDVAGHAAKSRAVAEPAAERGQLGQRLRRAQAQAIQQGG